MISPTHCVIIVKLLGSWVQSRRGRKELLNREKRSKRTKERKLPGQLRKISEIFLTDDSEQEHDEFHDEEDDRSSDEESSDDSLNWEFGQSMKRKKTVVSRLLQKEDFVEEGDDVQDPPAESDDEVLSLPPSPNMYLPASVDDLLEGSD